MDGKNLGDCARAAGCKCTSDASFRNRGAQLRKQLQYPINSLMAAAGLDSLAILRSIKQGIGAKTKHVTNIDGKITEYEVPNWHARARFTDMAIKVSGGYPKPQMELPFEVKDGKINIIAEFATNTESEAA